MTLYEMTQTAKYLYDLLQYEEIDEQTVADTLEAMGADEKLENYCKIIKQFSAEEDMLREEKRRLDAKIMVAKNAADRMRSAVLSFMDTAGKTKADAGTFKVSIGESKATVIFDPTAIPESYITMEPKYDKTAIKKAIENGKTVPGAKIEIGTKLTIR